MSKDLFNDTDKKLMNNNQPIDNGEGKFFDETLVNKDVIEFSKTPKDLDKEFEHTNPYTSFEDEGNSANPLLSKAGAKQVKADLKDIYKNQENFNSDHYMNLDGDKLREATNTLNDQDIDLNDQLTDDIKQGALVNDDGFKTVGDHDIFDGRQSLTGSGNPAPNVYQINHNPEELENSGDMNQDEDVDGNTLTMEYPEDQKDQLNSVKKNPQDINYLITNYTNPIMNNEELKTSNTTGPQSYKCGREMTKDNAGVYVACANTPKNRKKLDKILKKYAPEVDKAYRREIQPYAQRLNMSPEEQRNFDALKKSSNIIDSFAKSHRHQGQSQHSTMPKFSKSKADKKGQTGHGNGSTPSIGGAGPIPNKAKILAKKRLAHRQGPTR